MTESATTASEAKAVAHSDKISVGSPAGNEEPILAGAPMAAKDYCQDIDGSEDSGGDSGRDGLVDADGRTSSEMEPLEPQDEFYASGERKRVRSACIACHERKLRCVMLKKGVCRHCSEKGRICKPRIEKKRGRPRNSFRSQFVLTPGMQHMMQVQQGRPMKSIDTLQSLGTLSGLHNGQVPGLAVPGAAMIGMPQMATANGMMTGQTLGMFPQQAALGTAGLATNLGPGVASPYGQQNLVQQVMPNGQVVMVMQGDSGCSMLGPTQSFGTASSQMVTGKPVGMNGMSGLNGMGGLTAVPGMAAANGMTASPNVVASNGQPMIVATSPNNGVQMPMMPMTAAIPLNVLPPQSSMLNPPALPGHQALSQTDMTLKTPQMSLNSGVMATPNGIVNSGVMRNGVMVAGGSHLDMHAYAGGPNQPPLAFDMDPKLNPAIFCSGLGTAPPQMVTQYAAWQGYPQSLPLADV